MKDFSFIFRIFLLACIVVNTGQAQITNVDQLTAGQLLKFGKNAALRGDLYSAIYFMKGIIR